MPLSTENFENVIYPICEHDKQEECRKIITCIRKSFPSAIVNSKRNLNRLNNKEQKPKHHVIYNIMQQPPLFCFRSPIPEFTGRDLLFVSL